MKAANDPHTAELPGIPVPKKRGRPSTGKAKSGVERQREYLRRQRENDPRFLARAVAKTIEDETAEEVLQWIKIAIEKGDTRTAQLHYAAMGRILGVL